MPARVGGDIAGVGRADPDQEHARGELAGRSRRRQADRGAGGCVAGKADYRRFGVLNQVRRRTPCA